MQTCSSGSKQYLLSVSPKSKRIEYHKQIRSSGIAQLVERRTAIAQLVEPRTAIAQLVERRPAIAQLAERRTEKPGHSTDAGSSPRCGKELTLGADSLYGVRTAPVCNQSLASTTVRSHKNILCWVAIILHLL